MKYYSPTGRRSNGRPLKRLLITWGQLHDDDDDDDDNILRSSTEGFPVYDIHSEVY